MALSNKQSLLAEAALIRHADSEGFNTAERVGKMFVDIINAISDAMDDVASDLSNYATKEQLKDLLSLADAMTHFPTRDEVSSELVELRRLISEINKVAVVDGVLYITEGKMLISPTSAHALYFDSSTRTKTFILLGSNLTNTVRLQSSSPLFTISCNGSSGTSITVPYGKVNAGITVTVTANASLSSKTSASLAISSSDFDTVTLAMAYSTSINSGDSGETGTDVDPTDVDPTDVDPTDPTDVDPTDPTDDDDTTTYLIASTDNAPVVATLYEAGLCASKNGVTEAEAQAVTASQLGTIFKNNTDLISFDELKYFTALTAIPANAFAGCTALHSVTLPNTVTSLGASAFETCTALESINFPDGLTAIGSTCFYGTALSAVSLPDAVATLGDSAFESCTSLTRFIVSDNSALTAIEEATFNRCESLAVVYIPPLVTSIGAEAFGDCVALTILRVGNSTPPTVDATAFSGVTVADVPLAVPDSSAYIADSFWCTFGTSFSPSSGSQGIYDYCDVNMDGQTDVDDLTALIKCISGEFTGTEDGWTQERMQVIGDYNGDNSLDMQDYTAFSKKLMN